MHTRTHVSLLAALLMVPVAGPAHAGPPPAPWIAKEIGTLDTPPSVDVDARGLWTLHADGGQTFFAADKMLFVCQPLSGDGSILALILGQEGGSPDWNRAGVMIRENDTEGARNVHLAMTTGHGLAITFRPTARKLTIDEGGDRRYGPRQFPTWLRLQREGDRFTPFASYDGFGWTQLHAPISLPAFPRDALAGLSAVTEFQGPMTVIVDNPTVAPGQVSPIVQSCAGNGAVLLTWPPVTNAVAYIVRRSAPATPGFAADLLTATPLRETSFADTNLPNGKAVRYLVSAIFEPDRQRVEGMATAIIATPVATPPNLFGCDLSLEATQLRGAIAFDPTTGVYQISGAGGDIGDTVDRCFFASQLVKGDFQITARILDKPSRTHALAKAGLMVREALEGPARMAALVGTAANGVALQYRQKTGEAASPITTAIADKDFQPAFFLRLVRKGATITPFLSADGATFTPAGDPRTFDPPLAESLYVGYAITSHNIGAIATNTFSDLIIGPPPAQ
jgi:hypothetical protein